MRNKIVSLSVNPAVTLYHIGPPLELGRLPSFFYLALSGSDSLALDPFNQPVQFLEGRMIRIFSMTLPGHENGLPATNALHLWAEDIQREIDSIGSFLDDFSSAVDFVVQERFADPNRLGIAGLSRGGFIAAHAAARDERFKFLLAFAPLTQLGVLKEFFSLQEHPRVKNLDTTNLAFPLSKRHSRFYIGNHDTRVQTRACIDFALAIVDAAYASKLSTAFVDCIITPSLGRDGHGTALETFQQGAHWMAQSLGVP